MASTVATTFVAAVACALVFLPRTYSTAAGEWRAVTLSDGSVARLGPRTKVVVRYDKARRSIQQFAGEATYQVAKDPNRPFLVECGAATVRAIGTKFGVSCDAQASNVTVAEGTVSVSRRLVRRDQAASADQVRADAGQLVLVDQWTPLVPKPVDAGVALAWERGRIIFAGTPIEQAIREFNRRHQQQIPIPTYSGENYRVFGEFDLADPEEFIRFIEKSPALQLPK